MTRSRAPYYCTSSSPLQALGRPRHRAVACRRHTLAVNQQYHLQTMHRCVGAVKTSHTKARAIPHSCGIRSKQRWETVLQGQHCAGAPAGWSSAARTSCSACLTTVWLMLEV